MGNKKQKNSEPIAAREEHDISSQVLDPSEQEFIVRVTRFLIGLQSGAVAKAAKSVGFTATDQAEGWRLARLAGGEARPLDHHAPVADDTMPAEAKSLLVDIDQFENKWFPRTRGIIRRVVPRAEREAFEQTFFDDLAQQPLGPGVIHSVSKFLARVEELATSKLPSAGKVLEALRARGLTVAKAKEMKALLGSFEQEAAAPPKPSNKLADIIAARQAQREAFEDLKDWYADWGTTFRQELPTREQIRLGLIIVKRDSSDAEDGDGTEPRKPEKLGSR